MSEDPTSYIIRKSHKVSDQETEKIKAIAGKAKRLRESMNIGYETFAQMAGINRNTYYRLEQSAQTGNNFTLAILLKVIDAHNITLAEFFKDIE
jgi:transcriptional regulator with XRE-family HTH domain